MNDNEAARRGEAIICLMQWLADDEAHDAEIILLACDTLELKEADIEYICRHYETKKNNVIPIAAYISF